MSNTEIQYPSKEYFEEHLSYDPLTGAFKWIKSRQKRSSVVGTDVNGYISFRISDNNMKPTMKSYMAHRVAWIMTYGAIPQGMWVSHKNGNRSDNRIDNLELATIEDAFAKKTAYRNNRVGEKNIIYREVKNPSGSIRKFYRVQIWRDGKFALIKEAHTLEEAVKIREDFLAEEKKRKGP